MTANESIPPALPPLGADSAADAGPSLAPVLAGRAVDASRPAEQAGQREDHKRGRAALVASLPVRLDVKIPLPNFRLKDLAALAPAQVFRSGWPVAEDLPVCSGDVRLLWAEFAVADQQLTVRVTRVA